MTSSTGINIVTDTLGHTVSNTHTFSTGTGLSMVKTGDAYEFSNTQPVTAIRAGGACYMPGTVSELIFANATGSIADGKLTVTQTPITAGSGISFSNMENLARTHSRQEQGFKF